MFILLHWYCHRGFGCGEMITFTLKIFNIFGDVYTRDGTISLGQRDASAQIVVSHNYRTQVLGSIPFTPSVVTKWHDRHRYLSIYHMPHLMSLSIPRHCSKTLTNAGILSIKPVGTNFSDILIKRDNFSLTKMHLKMRNGCHFVGGWVKRGFVSKQCLSWLLFWYNCPHYTLLALCAGNHRSPVNSPLKRTVTRNFIYFLLLVFCCC